MARSASWPDTVKITTRNLQDRVSVEKTVHLPAIACVATASLRPVGTLGKALNTVACNHTRYSLHAALEYSL